MTMMVLDGGGGGGGDAVLQESQDLRHGILRRGLVLQEVDQRYKHLKLWWWW